MYISHNFLKFTKNLPDCREISLTSYLEQLIDAVQDWPFEKQVNFEPSRTRTEFYEGYSQITRQVTLQSSSPPSFRCRFWQYLPKGFSLKYLWFYEKHVRFEVYFCLSKMPHVFGVLEPPKVHRKQYENFIREAMKKGIVDKMTSQTPDSPIITLLGRINWVYVHGKITEFKTLSWLRRQKKSSGEEPSLVYEFAKQVENVFTQLPTITSPYIESQMPDFDSDLKETEVDEMIVEYKKIKAEFFEKYDKILLNAWGEKQFSDHLVPLGVSLDEWLQAGKNQLEKC